MATYANRICTTCGVRKPQPQMYQKEVYVETGKSQTGISGATLAGVFLAGDKKSGKQFRDWMFNNNQRTYKRKKMVWLCGICSGNERPVQPVVVEAPRVVVPIAPSEPDTGATVTPKQGMSTGAKWFWGIMLLALIGSIVDDNDKKKTTKNSPAAVTQSSP